MNYWSRHLGRWFAGLLGLIGAAAVVNLYWFFKSINLNQLQSMEDKIEEESEEILDEINVVEYSSS